MVDRTSRSRPDNIGRSHARHTRNLSSDPAPEPARNRISATVGVDRHHNRHNACSPRDSSGRSDCAPQIRQSRAGSPRHPLPAIGRSFAKGPRTAQIRRAVLSSARSAAPCNTAQELHRRTEVRCGRALAQRLLQRLPSISADRRPETRCPRNFRRHAFGPPDEPTASGRRRQRKDTRSPALWWPGSASMSGC